ncbi:ATP-dependent RNA helicase SrmB [Methylophaga lonarensis MPL]|uniref:ATP-dependent RNA helicase SrmB n=3 Tax=Methylophaga lonarensis TaxID=999151 RepID=M7NXQ7_9GAMM|nr:DEAD/DEAH box helicase [Methylophaga lonarensis]EMR11976.1 ATP-dependent RNA helicase SrmB [Methylophaga lonarensis MPL]
MTFDDLFLDDILLKAVTGAGYVTPTPIQAAAIPPIFAGRDVLAGAATGTGKTAAFVLPILQRLLDEKSESSAASVLILAPTRELAHQIQHVIELLGREIRPKVVMLTGGINVGRQHDLLNQSCDVLIATPGRLLSMVENKAVDLQQIELVVIDEADRMLDMGQGPDVMMSLASIEHRFQCCLFSATLSGHGIKLFADNVLKDPEHIQLHAANAQTDRISHYVYLADNHEHKQLLLTTVLKSAECQRALVFCNKRERAEELTEWLQSQNLSAQVLHGDFDLAQRRQRIRKFREGQIKITVATDVAARGLDLPDVSHVINYDIPYRGDTYIHRVGRTGRGEQHGTAINLVEPHDHQNLERIEFHMQAQLPIRKLKGLAAKGKANRALMKKRETKTRYVSKALRQPPATDTPQD